MGAKICMNTFCGATVSSTWKKGWDLKSGQIADLCLNCGSVYEKLAYCDTFHCEEAGWRECSMCNKRLHCGCSASLSFIEIQDFGGVWCINCAHSASAGCYKSQGDVLPSEASVQNSYASCELQNSKSIYKLDGDSHNDGRLLNLGIPSENLFFGLQMEIKSPIDFSCKGFENLSHSLIEPHKLAMPSDDRPKVGVKDVQEPITMPSLNISLGTQDPKIYNLDISGGIEEGEKNRSPLNQSMQKARHNLRKPAKSYLPKSSESNKGSASQKRIGRPPAEARIRNQLLPRYWPRITEQELQKLSGDLNSTIVPLFEKVLSASDASRIGRLVLPKACAEAYFPKIHQSEGLPLKIQDVKGNEWTFQFRFWPNNNSRMYVLEGVTPCIQTMELQAGDTVIFSRIDPGGKFVIGSRKTSSSFEAQDQQTSAPHNGLVSEDNICSDASERPATVNIYSGFLQSLKGNKENTLNGSSEQSNMLNGDIDWSKNDKSKDKVSKDLLQQPKVSSEAKAVTVGSRNKRSLMHSEDAVELRITWGEAQDLFRPPKDIQANVVVIEEFEFEEYDEPPVFGKRTLFTTGLLGGENQWAQCDKCAKWRKLPWDVLIPPMWSCLENVWDLSRSYCLAPEEISSEELDLYFRVGKDSKKRKVAEQGSQPCGLDALADAAVLGETVVEPPFIATTTRHPRHRPGCSCIVCIQPPSGKGKHESNCSCNVCSTVKRRFKTLMMRKKQKRPNEKGTEKPQQKTSQNDSCPTEESKKQSLLEESESCCKEVIDLNCDPAREDDVAGTSISNHNTNQNESSGKLSAQPKSISNHHTGQNESSDVRSTQPKGDNKVQYSQDRRPEPKHGTELCDELVASMTAVEERDKEKQSSVLM